MPSDAETGADPVDPYREAVYRSEAEALADGGRRFARFTELSAFVQAVVMSTFWESTFPGAPIEITLFRRSRGATFSAATVDGREATAAVWIRDGSWDLVTVLHELAHVAAGTGDPSGPHGATFVDALLRLWREYLGFHAYGALRSALLARGVPLRRDLRPGDSATV